MGLEEIEEEIENSQIYTYEQQKMNVVIKTEIFMYLDFKLM